MVRDSRIAFLAVVLATFLSTGNAQYCDYDSDCREDGYGDNYFCCNHWCCDDKYDDWIDENLVWFIVILVVSVVVTLLVPLICCCLCPCCILAQRRKTKGRVIAVPQTATTVYAFSTVQSAPGATAQDLQPPAYASVVAPVHASYPRQQDAALPLKY